MDPSYECKAENYKMFRGKKMKENLQDLEPGRVLRLDDKSIIQKRRIGY